MFSQTLKQLFLKEQVPLFLFRNIPYPVANEEKDTTNQLPRLTAVLNIKYHYTRTRHTMLASDVQQELHFQLKRHKNMLPLTLLVICHWLCTKHQAFWALTILSLIWKDERLSQFVTHLILLKETYKNSKVIYFIYLYWHILLVME